MRNPCVSVIISAYNKETTIRKCIESVLAQTLQGIEIIIIDDCSTDHTAEIAREYAAKHSQIVLHVNEQNRGLGANENYGVNSAKGEYIGFVDADDYVGKDYFKKLYRAAKHADVDVACGEFMVVYPDESTPTQMVVESIFCRMDDKVMRKYRSLGSAA